jgi:hypothetical protein
MGRGALPDADQGGAEKNSQWPFNFLHCVKPRDDYDPGSHRRARPAVFVALRFDRRTVLDAGGGRLSHLPICGEPLRSDAARGLWPRPAQMVLPALKTLNAQKTVFLKQGHRAADPGAAGADDGLMPR